MNQNEWKRFLLWIYQIYSLSLTSAPTQHHSIYDHLSIFDNLSAPNLEMIHFRTLEVADLPFLKTLPSPRAFKLGLIKVLAGNENNSELPALLLVRSPQCWNLETLLLQFNQAPTFINQFLQLLMPLSPLILELTSYLRSL